MRILLVDDEEPMIRIWARFLEPLNAEIRVAMDVDSAIEQMKLRPPPDIVLLDLLFPGGGASDTVQAIVKLREFNPNLTVIVISGMDEKRLLQTIANAHVEGVLMKGDDITQSKLLRAMKDALSKSPNSSELLDIVAKLVDSLTVAETKRKTGKLV